MKASFYYALATGLIGLVLGYLSMSIGWKSAIFTFIAIMASWTGGAYFAEARIHEIKEEEGNSK